MSILRWPNEFTNPTPFGVLLGDEFTQFLEQMLAAEVTVHADEIWALFSFNRHKRRVEFVRRGRLGYGFPQCWEVLPVEDDAWIKLGPIFGIDEHACVVTAGFDNVRRFTEGWLEGHVLDSLLRDVTFWERANASSPLVLHAK